jgi:hypothetical protein
VLGVLARIGDLVGLEEFVGDFEIRVVGDLEGDFGDLDIGDLGGVGETEDSLDLGRGRILKGLEGVGVAAVLGGLVMVGPIVWELGGWFWVISFFWKETCC